MGCGHSGSSCNCFKEPELCISRGREPKAARGWSETASSHPLPSKLLVARHVLPEVVTLVQLQKPLSLVSDALGDGSDQGFPNFDDIYIKGGGSGRAGRAAEPECRLRRF